MNFGYKQLKLPLPNASSEEGIEVLRGSNVLNTVGRTLFFEAYFYFSLFLVALYITLCFSENIFNFVFGPKEGGSNPTTEFNGGSGVWPLTVAMLIVSFSPDAPILKELELFFRRLSRYSAGIYRNVVGTRDKLRKIQFSKLPQTVFIQSIQEKTSLVEFVQVMQKLTPPQIEHSKKALLDSYLLHYWTLSEHSNVNWGTTQKSNAQKLLGDLSKKMTFQQNELENYIVEVNTAEFDGKSFEVQFRRAFPDGFTHDLKETVQATTLWQEFNSELIEFGNRANEAIQKVTEISDELYDLFAILFTQNRFPNYDKGSDPALRTVLRYLRSYSSQATRNLIVRILLLFFASAAIIATSYIFYREAIMKEAPNNEALFVSIKVGLKQAAGYLVGCMASVLTSLALLRLWDDQIESLAQPRPNLPMNYVAATFLVCTAIAFISRLLLWYTFNLPEADTLNSALIAFKSIYPIELSDSISFGFVGVLFFWIIFRMKTKTGGRRKAFGFRYYLVSGFFSIMSAASIFVGHNLFSQNPPNWYIETNSSLLYLILAFFVPLISFVALRGFLISMATYRSIELEVSN